MALYWKAAISLQFPGDDAQRDPVTASEGVVGMLGKRRTKRSWSPAPRCRHEASIGITTISSACYKSQFLQNHHSFCLLSSHRNGCVFRFNRDCGVSPRSGSLAVCDAPSDRCSCFPSAGIIGLDVALVLSKRGLGQCITIVAEHLPGDTSPSYTSPWYDAPCPCQTNMSPDS